MPSRFKNLGIAGISALTGCVSLIVVLGALFIGLWIDYRMGTEGLGVVTTLILSVPISLFLMIRIALTLVKHIDPMMPNNNAHLMDIEEEESLYES